MVVWSTAYYIDIGRDYGANITCVRKTAEAYAERYNIVKRAIYNPVASLDRRKSKATRHEGSSSNIELAIECGVLGVSDASL
jgi:hypothetical protein